MNTKPIKHSAQDLSEKGAPKVSSAPFSKSWTNNRPLASCGGLTDSPAGKLSPKALAGVGKGK